ncbi:MAG TPA: TadE/TadG family type IV pilus assembly protein [Stellaceae bacterium]|nr:TadE/TadG family type IV pilus assembly protein [Stellaceae bacterium]
MIARALTVLRNRAGVAAVEFVLLAPILATILFGLFEGSQAILAYMKLIDSTQTLADLVSQQESVASSDIDNFYAGAQAVMAPYSTTSLGFVITSVTYDATTGAASVAWQDTRNATVSGNVATMAAGYGSKGESVIIVQGSYGYSSLLHFILPGSISMGQVAFSKPRQVAAIPHS